MSHDRAARLGRDLSLNGKLVVALSLTFGLIVVLFLVLLIPFQRQQRRRLVERDQRLLTTLRENYERNLIYDLVSENLDSLTIDMAELARQPGVVWVRIHSASLEVSATGDVAIIRRLAGDEAWTRAKGSEVSPVLVVRDGRGLLTGLGGQALAEVKDLPKEVFPDDGRTTTAAPFRDVRWPGHQALVHRAPLKAADETFGEMDLAYSLDEVQRAERVTRGFFYGLAGATFLTSLLLLTFLISRMVIAPVRGIREAMGRASAGDLDARLPVTSGDEIGAIADAFNRMTADLKSSRAAVEAYSRELEERVARRTMELSSATTSLEAVIRHAATGVLAVDGDGRVTTVNARAAEMLGLAADLGRGRPLEELLQGDARRIAELALVTCRRGSTVEHQLSLRLPRGRRILSVTASPLPGGDLSGGAVVVIDDLTDVLASQRLQAWKEAVERVIHEIKNPLTPIALSAQTLEATHLSDPVKFEEMFPKAMEMIVRSVGELKALISDFTRFYRLPRLLPRAYDLNLAVSEALASYEQARIDGVSIRRELAPDLPPVEVDPHQIRRVFLNIINNGLEAMEGMEGALTVRTAPADEPGFAVVTVRDEGPGIDDVEKVFEPYYTTKPKGTGLGLLISREIVEEHGGRIHIRSRLGSGTEVEVVLPLATEAPPVEAATENR